MALIVEASSFAGFELFSKLSAMVVLGRALLPVRVVVGGGGRGLGVMSGDSTLGGVPLLWGRGVGAVGMGGQAAFSRFLMHLPNSWGTASLWSIDPSEAR